MSRTARVPEPLLPPWWPVALLTALTIPALLDLAGLGVLCVLLPSGALVLLLVYVLWRTRGRLLGPLWYYEAVRLARRGRVSILRVGYALLLLAGLGMAYADRFWRGDWLSSLFAADVRLEPNALALLGVVFFRALVAAQSAALFVLTPVYLTAAVTEEKEGRTLETLLSTPLADREVILGKLAGRLLHVAGVLLTGLPVLYFILWWGGIGLAYILTAFVTTALTLLSVGAISIFASVHARTRLGALLMTYGILGLSSFCLVCLLPFATPFTFLAAVEGTGDWSELLMLVGLSGGQAGSLFNLLSVYAFLHGLIAFIFLALAVGHLRREALPPNAPWVPTFPAPPPEPVTAADRVVARLLETGGVVDRGGLLMPVPAVGDRPLLWKELYFGSQAGAREVRGVVFLTLLSTTCATLLVLLVEVITRALTWLSAAPGTELHFSEAFRLVLRVLVVPHLGGWCLGTAFQAAACVSRERERHTWDSILTLPLDRPEILRAKWLGAALWGRGLALPLSLALAASLLAGLVSPLGLLLLTLAGAVHVAFFASLGLWLSLVCRSTLRACLWTGAVLLAVTVGPWLVLAFSRSLSSSAEPALWLRSLLEYGINPVGAWWFLDFSWSELAAGVSGAGGPFQVQLLAALAGLAYYAAAAWALWRLARRRMTTVPRHT